MNGRLFTAVNDIRHVQNQIEKILGHDSLISNHDTHSKYFTQKSHKEKHKYQSFPYKSKQKATPKSKKKSTSKSKSKSPKNLKITTKIDQEVPKTPVKQNQSQKKQSITNIWLKNINDNNLLLNKRQSFKKQSVLEKISVNDNSNSRGNQIAVVQQQSQTKNIFLKWKKKDQEMNLSKTMNLTKEKYFAKEMPLNNTKVPERKVQVSDNESKFIKTPAIAKEYIYNLSQENIQEMKSSKRAKQQHRNQDNDEVPYYMNHKNEIPLRSDEIYLISKYTYKKNEKGQNLKKKYKLLDERIDRLKTQIFSKAQIDLKSTYTNSELPYYFKAASLQQMNEKRKVLNQYYRYSPIYKLVKINEKLKYQTQRGQRPQIVRPKSVSPKNLKIKI